MEGRWASACSTFSGTFDKEYALAGGAPIQPTDKPVKFEVISTFRYNKVGLLTEEWVQNDRVGFLK